ncbi:MAG: hemerythrin domain-containing protein [SAR324 cluster bacterium]|nr:hemerythrin domain-containing protein [SAR324 cluster bacterium]
MPETFTQALHAEHQECDRLFAIAEEAALDGNIELAKDPIGAAIAINRAHFQLEETILFPAFEEATQMTGGPTAVMRMEHDQMRDLLNRIEQATIAGKLDEVAKVFETLMILMQQHNLKEENMLYPMMDQALAHKREELLAKIKAD